MLDQPFIPALVRRAGRVLSAIDFNHKPMFTTEEVDDEGADLILPNKFVAAQTAGPQAIPELLFGIGG